MLITMVNVLLSGLSCHTKRTMVPITIKLIRKNKKPYSEQNGQKKKRTIGFPRASQKYRVSIYVPTL